MRPERREINAKVRDAQMSKIPYSLVLGRKRPESGQVAVRRYESAGYSGHAQADFIAHCSAK